MRIEEGLALQIKVAISKPALIQPSVREQLGRHVSLLTGLISRAKVHLPTSHRTQTHRRHSNSPAAPESSPQSLGPLGDVDGRDIKVLGMDKQYGMLNHPEVKKKILVGGAGPLPHFPPGTKLVFHFQTLKDNFERTVIDDSRLAKRPAEIFVGKMFKMEVWETLLTSMRVGEVAEFWCGAIHTGLYAIVSKGMRLIAQGKDPLEGQKHMCGMGNLFNYHSTGYPELDELMKDPQPLIFIMELLQVGDPFSYKRESWMMEKDEKLEAVPSLHMQGNALVKQMRYKEAAAMYQEAVVLLRTVQSREMPGHEDYINLARLIIPLVLNYCQCMLELEEYYEVIEHTTELLDKHPDCVKGYYKRAKAHTAVWNEREARRDFNMVANLDVTLAPLIRRELKSLSECMKEKYWEEKEKYWNILEEKERKERNEEEEEAEEEKVSEEKMSGEKDEDGRDEEEKDEDEKEKGEKDEGATTVGDEEPKTEHRYVPKEEVHRDGKEERAPVREEATPSEEVAVRPVSLLQSAPRAVTEGKDWQQMLRMVMFLQEEGNFYMKEQHHDQGARKFQEALEYVDHLQTKETAYKGEDWESLEKVRLPLTLNLSQCMLEMQDYQEVVELTNKLLKTHKGNLKALYQRARAHSALCHEEQARRDFTKLQSLDASFKPAVRLELKKMGENIRLRHIHQRKTYRDTTQEKWGPGGAKGPATAAGKKPEKTVTFANVQGSAGTEGADGKAGSRNEEEERRPEELAAADARVDRGAREPEKADGRGDEESGNQRSGDAGATGGGERRAESGALPGDRQAQPDKPAGDKDKDPAQSTGATDNVASKRSGPDKGGRKVKRPSGAAKGQAKASRENKGTENDTASGHTQSTPTSRNQLPAFGAGTTGEARGRGSAEAKVEDRQAAGGRETDRQGCEAKVEDRQAAGGRETDRKGCEAKVQDRQAAGGRETDRKGCEAKVQDRQAAGGRETDRKSCEAKVQDRQAAGGRETDRKSCEAKVEDRQAAGGRETDRKSCEAKVEDRQAAGGRETDRKGCEAKVQDRQAAGGRETDRKGCEAKVQDRQAAGGRETDRKGCDGQQAELLRGGRLEALTGSIDSPPKKSKRKPKKKK